ncbi:Uncharacterised protein [Mycobacteroides abscessus subsp. abscessus]|nr:Uncharacterised protein [Mycobacteroides abscessus subsp. abscessus]
MICTGSSNLLSNRAARLGWRLTTVRTASCSRSASNGPVMVMSSCMAYTSSLCPRLVLAWNSSPCCNGVRGSTSSIA